MGGSAFTDLNNPSASLLTPRMSPSVYQYARDRALRILHTFYAQAECPIEAPAKADYGDVDILVASPHNQAATDAASLAPALGATQYKKNSPTTNFALPWPTAEELNTSSSKPQKGKVSSAEATIADGDGLSLTTTMNTNAGAPHDHERVDNPRHIQLDVHICPTPERFQWELFHQAHGDLWNILGGMIRPYGLVVNHVGLYLRLAGVGSISKDQRTLQLTNSPSAVLKFLDLDESRYWTPFDSLDAMFAYAASCRFYDPKAYEGKEDLKANDRLRMKKRPMFMKWYEGYLLEHREDEPGRTAGADREDVVEEAKRVFGVERVYEEKRATGLRKMGEEKLWSDARKGLPVEGLRIGVVMKGFKREVVGKTLAADSGVMSGEKKEPVCTTSAVYADYSAVKQEVGELSDVQRAYVDGRFDEIAEWVQADWEGIEQRQIAHERQQSTRHLLAKLERDKAKAEVDALSNR